MQRTELFCGLATGVAGVIAMCIWILAVPMNIASVTSNIGPITPDTVRNIPGGGSAFIYMSLLGILAIMVTLGAIFHLIWRANVGRYIVWVAACFLILGTLCAFGVGLLFWPSALFSLICAVASARDEHLSRRLHV